MGSLTIRNLDDHVIDTLKAQAKSNHRSLKSELRYLLTRRVDRGIRLTRLSPANAEDRPVDSRCASDR